MNMNHMADHLAGGPRNKTPGMEPLGMHVIAEFYGCQKISDPHSVEKTLRQAAITAKATILFSHIHDFGEAMGVTGVVILSESHISIHSWPEYQYAALDIFMCGDAKPMAAIEFMKTRFLPTHVELQEIKRGGRPDKIEVVQHG